MAARLALTSDSGLPASPGWLRRGLARLQALCVRRPVRNTVHSLSEAALKDIGLCRNDLPAVRAGAFAADDTRRRR
jgi:uncharacterized protein YjiS (DUF1127 family)